MKRLVALVLLMRTYSQIVFSVIERIQVDVVDFAAFRSDKYYSVNTESVAVANITRTRIALVPSPIRYFPVVLGIKAEHLART